MSNCPLYIKYQTVSGGCYIFDAATNAILRVSRVVYSIIDDYRQLDNESLIEKYQSQFKKTDLQDALAALQLFCQKGILRPHIEFTRPKLLGIRFEDATYSLDEFLANYSRMLTLELTHRCNLNCEYCCFGKYYSRYRSHGTATIDKEIAEKAISYHLDKLHSDCCITFYGGEPLLEFSLLRDLVFYTEQRCQTLGKEPPRFALTTNGTLLTDEIIHFFVEHRFSVLVSIDGCKESHNKYRVFRNNGEGSYDLVRKNMQRFVELYPDFYGRGISLTLTADNDFEETNRVVKELIPYYPTVLVNFVNSSIDFPLEPCCEHNTDECCKDRTPQFHIWNQDFINRYQSLYKKFEDMLFVSPEQARKEYPLFYKIFEGEYRSMHKRTIEYQSVRRKMACSCIPGAVRLYCSIQGDYFPCEKTETTDLLKIGSVHTGIDAAKVASMIQILIDATDCDQCVGKDFCAICPNFMNGQQGHPFERFIKSHCVGLPQHIANRLSAYTSIMEKQPNIFEMYKNESTGNDWLPHIQFVVKIDRKASILSKERTADGKV
ncbi:Cys-rich peptide radical SAM maturase CcpM [Planctomycetales bacterium]|nr:Cys-rich peptide radical SAM maturase CcpM [Planctomycetales bacterium]